MEPNKPYTSRDPDFDVNNYKPRNSYVNGLVEYSSLNHDLTDMRLSIDSFSLSLKAGLLHNDNCSFYSCWSCCSHEGNLFMTALLDSIKYGQVENPK